MPFQMRGKEQMTVARGQVFELSAELAAYVTAVLLAGAFVQGVHAAAVVESE